MGNNSNPLANTLEETSIDIYKLEEWLYVLPVFLDDKFRLDIKQSKTFLHTILT